jgi:2-polyprenyl-6-hydroxyphenyl methylase/3-demethylubiquinone-9 3-methyltransferase
LVLSEQGPNADARFVDYYRQQSQSEQTLARFSAVKRQVLSILAQRGSSADRLTVADIGCGPGAQSLMWATDGHQVWGGDISVPLIEIARERARNAGLPIAFEVASAESLPLPDRSFDVVLVPELLEHVPRWQACVGEAVRILKPGGVVYFNTTNYLCPQQQEFELPLYSWYPAWLKRRCVAKALSTHRQWVQYTSFPAVNWFSFYSLRKHLATLAIDSLDRFDVMTWSGPGLRARLARVLCAVPPLRYLGHVLTPYTLVFGIKRASS